MRGKIARVEVIELSTNRVLFELDEQTVSKLRKTPKEPPINWDPDERPMVELRWEIGLLLYVGDDPVPFLGFLFHDDQLYFVDEADPWDPSIFVEDEVEDEVEDDREVYGIPVDVEVRICPRPSSSRSQTHHSRENALQSWHIRPEVTSVRRRPAVRVRCFRRAG